MAVEPLLDSERYVIRVQRVHAEPCGRRSPKRKRHDVEQPEHQAMQRSNQVAAIEPLFFTVDEVAHLLRTTRRAIYARVARGQLPGVLKDGRRVLVDRENLLEWLEQRRALSPMEIRR